MRSNPRVTFALRLGLTAAPGLLCPGLPAAAATPCTDGIFFGNVTPFYQAILGDDNHNGTLDTPLGETPTAYYDSLPQSAKNMVHCGADPARNGPDAFRYRQRPVSLGGVVRDQENRVIARVYDHLDVATKRFYVAVVLTGCHTDNVFGRKSVHATDEAYQLSVFWEPDHTHASSEDSGRMVGGFRCNDSSGTTVYDYAPDGIELDLISLGSGSASNDEPEAATWVTNVEKPAAPFFPPAMAWTHGTSSWWNMEMRMALTDPEVASAMQALGVSYWDVEDNSPPGGGDERPADGDWKSPFTDPSNLFGQIGWGSTWFSDRYLWEWQQVYEFSFESDACSGAPDDWYVQTSLDTPASPSKRQNEICGIDANQGSLTVLKDAIPDDPWSKYEFFVAGPTPAAFTLQDPGSNECPADPLCGNPGDAGAWTHPDRITTTNMIASDSFGGATYRVQERNPEAGYTAGWECKNAAVPLASTCDPASSIFDFAACAAVAPVCAPARSDWADGYISCQESDPDFAICAPGDVGAQTDAFELCSGGHVLCRFINHAGQESDEVCLESENAIGDLQVLGGVESETVSFTTAAAPVSAADAPDSIFLASFMPIADESRWPGTVDHFVQPLPVVTDAEGDLLPDRSRLCAGPEDTACLAWDAAVEILTQAPDASAVLADRQIGLAATERRVAYTQAASGATVPRPLRAFDYDDADALADEYDLWLGMDIAFVSGDTESETAARDAARHIIRETLQERTVSVTDLSTGEPRTVPYVVGDVFHGDPVLLGGPANFFYLANDLEGNGRACDDGSDPNPGYRCFFEKHRRRRKVLLAPSNDGQLHAFDAGFFAGSVQRGHLIGEFDRGTGRELFAHIPRAMLAHTRDLVSQEHGYGIDGPLTVDDVFIDPVHAGTPSTGERQWRSVIIGSYREGGRGLYALDLTQPDPVAPRTVLDFAGRSGVEYVPVAPAQEVPTCSALDRSPPPGCGLPYPSVLWEFGDECTFVNDVTGRSLLAPCDEDTNGYPDLAFSWSKVNTGRVLVTPAGEPDPVVRFVALFGGGIDPRHRGLSGNFLYMVDIETGKVLYKTELSGAVPSEPAAVDTDANGILDTVYIGTTAGLVYKVDISQPAALGASSGQVDESLHWTPFPIFDTGGREIFFRPTVFYDSSSGHYALAFGTGDREDLWSEAGGGEEGRFYVILDPGFAGGIAPIASGPLTESSYQQIPVASDPSTGNFLVAPVSGNQPGWVLQLGDDERVVTDALAISGLLAFTTFDPDRPDLCTFGGNGSVYTLLATNANAVGGEAERGIPIEGFAGKPVVTPQGFSRQTGPGTTADPFEAAQPQSVRQSLTGLFPAECRFGNFSLNVSSSLSSSEVMPLAQIPVCVARQNWTEP